ncbi:hypothetical protein LTR95_006004 [Oleoguttula sp. CCFEE 5521]
MSSYHSQFPASSSAYQTVHQYQYDSPYQQATPHHHTTRYQHPSQHQYPSQYPHPQVNTYANFGLSSSMRAPAAAPAGSSVRAALMNAQENTVIPQHVNDSDLGSSYQHGNYFMAKTSQSTSSGSSADTVFDDSESSPSDGSADAILDNFDQSSLAATGDALPAHVDRKMGNQGKPPKSFPGFGVPRATADWIELDKMWDISLSQTSARTLLKVLAAFGPEIRQIDEACAKIGRLRGTHDAPTTPKTSIDKAGAEVSETAPLGLGLVVAEVLRTLTSICDEADSVLREIFKGTES